MVPAHFVEHFLGLEDEIHEVEDLEPVGDDLQLWFLF